MQTKSNAAAAAVELESYFDSRGWGHAADVAVFTIHDLVLERLPNGECAYLKPEDDEPRYVLTDFGRRALREADCFGPWPTVAEACSAS